MRRWDPAKLRSMIRRPNRSIAWSASEAARTDARGRTSTSEGSRVSKLCRDGCPVAKPAMSPTRAGSSGAVMDGNASTPIERA